MGIRTDGFRKDGVGTSVHSSMLELDADDHDQYVLLGAASSYTRNANETKLAAILTKKANRVIYVVGSDQTAMDEAIAAASAGDEIRLTQDTTARIESAVPLRVHLMGKTLTNPDDAQSIIKFSGSKSVNTYVLAGAAARGDRSVTLTDAGHELVAGDLVILRDDTTRTGDGAQNVNQEVHEVETVAGAVVTFTTPVHLPKEVAATNNVQKVTMLEGIVVRSGTLAGFAGATSGSEGVYLIGCRDSVVHNVRTTDTLGYGVRFDYCYNVAAERPRVSDPQATTSGAGYGVGLTLGTAQYVIRDLVATGMRHALDLGGSVAGLVENARALRSVGSAFVLSHNGWDSDMTLRDCVSYGGTEYAFEFSSQGVADPYDVRAYGMRLLNCRAYFTDSDTFNVGLYVNAPMTDCVVDVAEFVLNDGSYPGTGNNTQGVRILPVGNVNTTLRRVTVRGAEAGFLVFASSATAPTVETEPVRIVDACVVNADKAFEYQFASAVHIDGADVHDAVTAVLSVTTNATAPLRYLWLDNVRLHGFTPGTLLPAGFGTLDSQGVVGRVGTLVASTTSSGNLAPTAGDVLTAEELLLHSRSGFVRLAPAGALSLDATTPLANGWVEGQTVTLLNVSGSALTVPDGTNTVHNGAASVVLDAARRAVTYVWSNGNWWETA